MINDGAIQHMRVGGGARIGARLLSRTNSRVCRVRAAAPVSRLFARFAALSARVYSPTKANREKFASETNGKLGIDITAVDAAREAVEGVDILSTDSMEAIFEADWLEAGMQNLEPDETSREALDMIDAKIRQGTPGVEMDEGPHVKSGVGHSPVAAGTEEGRFPPQGRGSFRVRYPSDLVTGKTPGRISELSECRVPGVAVRCGWRTRLPKDARLGERPQDTVVFAGHPRLTAGRRDAVTEQAH